MAEHYTYSAFDKKASAKIKETIKRLAKGKPCVLVCVGSVKVAGDALAPLVGTILRAQGFGGYVYGTMSAPVTAKEVDEFGKTLKSLHPGAVVIAIDSAVGGADEVGEIKVINAPLVPGLALKRSLNKLGDLSVIGVVGERKEDNLKVLKETDFAIVGKMAEVISKGFADVS